MGIILRVWFPGVRGKKAPLILSVVRNREASAHGGCLSMRTTAISIRNTDCVCCREVVRFSESLLSEVILHDKLLPSARMRSEGTVVGSVCVCLLLSISLVECLFVSQTIRPT